MSIDEAIDKAVEDIRKYNEIEDEPLKEAQEGVKNLIKAKYTDDTNKVLNKAYNDCLWHYSRDLLMPNSMQDNITYMGACLMILKEAIRIAGAQRNEYEVALDDIKLFFKNNDITAFDWALIKLEKLVKKENGKDESRN